MPQLIDWPHRDSFGIVAIGDEVGNGGRQLLLLLCAEILSGWGDALAYVPPVCATERSS